MTLRFTGKMLFGLLLICHSRILAAAEGNVATNLQVLPEEITRSELNQIMLENLAGLGLPRREGEGCLYCHEGSLEVPRAQWNYASDAKIAKRKARSMMAMVREINERLDELEERIASDLRVTCASCHAGRTDPRPLPDLLLSRYETEGLESTIETYHQLRQQYEGGNAYNFQEVSLAAVATGLASRGEFNDAIGIAQLNESINPSASTIGFTLSLQTMQQILGSGVEQGISYFEQRWKELGNPELGFQVLDNVGWQLFRTGQHSSALQLFEHNLSLFPAAYTPVESLAEALWDSDTTANRDRAKEILERWLGDHPGQGEAQRKLMQWE